MAEALSYLLVIFREPMLLVMTAIGTCAGVYVGAIPGLCRNDGSFTAGIVHIRLGDTMALAIMIGVFVGAVFGGSRSAILLNIPALPQRLQQR